MTIQRNGTVPSRTGSAATFTGHVRIDSPFQAEAPARVSGVIVTFEPGARTFWHSHPLGQTLIVTDGVGWTQCEGEAKVEIRAGDVIWCGCQRVHWHGATATTAMTHVAITESLDGKVVDWVGPVTDEEFLAGPVQTD